jgi:hypothetical protein
MDDLSNVLIIYLGVVLIWLVVAIFALMSILKRKDMTMPLKVVWCAVIVFAPLIGLVIYLIYNYNKEKQV